MSCDACARMQESTIPTAQGWLVETRSPARLRPLGRPAVVVQFYCCSLYGTNWLSESDPLGSGTAEWVCLYNASSVLAPVSVLHPGPACPSRTPAFEAGLDNHASPTELPRHSFG